MTWLTNYAKRKAITVNHSGALTNYQKKVIVNRSTGSDSGDNVYIGSAGCEADYDDIRFTTSDGTTLCDYWIVSSSASLATIWVEIPSIADGNTTLYLYYGYSSATAASNGDNTFIFFDHFPGSELDTTTKWDETEEVGSYSVGSSLLDIVGGSSVGEHIRSKTTASPPCAFQAYGYFSSEGNYRNLGLGSKDAISPDLNSAQAVYADGRIWYSRNTSGTQTDTRTVDLSGYHTIDICVTATSSKFYADGSLEKTLTTYVPAAEIGPYFGAWGSGNHCVVDYCFLRNYDATEPTISAWGSEESATSLPVFDYYYDHMRG